MQMSSSSRAWIAAASIGVVEALKYQGAACRWNQAVRTLHQRVKGTVWSSRNQAGKNMARPVSNAASGKIGAEKMKKKKRPEAESVRKVMYMSSWGPY